MAQYADTNMYEVALEETRELFGEFLEGARTAPMLALSGGRLDERAQAALTSTAASLGYGSDACTFVALRAEAGALDPHALFMLVEGLDSLCLVVADDEAARSLSQAYRCPVELGSLQRVFGRPCVAFDSFERMLADSGEKQRAWALLKQLPRFGRQR